ncbi:MAG: type II toxin-antitoxin system VapC family toxin [Candidatus Coatesbacteria bacterium]
MILDSSALVAILFREEGHERFLRALDGAVEAAIGAPTLVETAIVVSARMGRDARGLVSRFLREGGIAVLPMTEAHAVAAIEAWHRYGKGRHPASLNFGDCMAYAVARIAGRPLLCSGRDFEKTDLVLA